MLLAAQSEPVIDAEGDEHRLDDRIAAVRSGSKVVILDFNVALSAGKISEQMTRSIVMAAVRRLEESR